MDITAFRERIKQNARTENSITGILGVKEDWAANLLKDCEREIVSEVASATCAGKSFATINSTDLIVKLIDKCSSVEEIIWLFYLLGYQRAKMATFCVVEPAITFFKPFVERVEEKTKSMQKYFFDGVI